MTNSKPLCVVQAPFATRSGYGDMSRDYIRQILDTEKYEVKLVSMPWGSTPMNALDMDNPEHKRIMDCMMSNTDRLDRKPDLFVQISVPNEFQPIGKYNIGITAGIETTVCSPQWIEGCNRMDLIITISNHSKSVFESTRIEARNPNTNEVIRSLSIETPVKVVHNCADTDVFRYVKAKDISDPVNELFDAVEEDFNYLFVGHWLKGEVGEDRKNLGLLVKIFCETFKGDDNAPGLILKTSGADFSIMDREEILSKVASIRKNVGDGCPNVYVIHGDLSPSEMNELYNHPKIKVNVSFTKGEGFGRPLLEASLSGKPVVASAWSGHVDFLNPEEAILLVGELKKVDESAVWDGVILKDASWFNIDEAFAKKALLYIRENYKSFQGKARRLGRKNAKEFSYDSVRNTMHGVLEESVPEFESQPTLVDLELPTLKKL